MACQKSGQYSFSFFHTSSELCDFRNAENLARLQRSLTGQARAAVHSLLAVPGNVPEIIRVLQARFGRPDLDLRALIGKIKKLPPIAEGDFTGLISFATAIRYVTVNITMLNVTGHMTNPQLRSDLVQWLPISLRMQWGEFLEQHQTVDPPLDTFSDWLSKKADAISLISPLDAEGDDNQNRSWHTSHFIPPTGEALVAASSHKRMPTCKFCHQ